MSQCHNLLQLCHLHSERVDTEGGSYLPVISTSSTFLDAFNHLLMCDVEKVPRIQQCCHDGSFRVGVDHCPGTCDVSWQKHLVGSSIHLSSQMTCYFVKDDIQFTQGNKKMFKLKWECPAFVYLILGRSAFIAFKNDISHIIKITNSLVRQMVLI